MKKDKNKPIIFHYQDPLIYLKDMIAYIKRTNAAFSYRYFAKKSGFASQSALKFILDGQRGFTQEGTKKIAKGLGLTENEMQYFALMVSFFQEKSTAKKNQLFLSLTSFQKKQKIKNLSQDHYEYFSNWYHPAVRELIRCSEFQNDPAWIAKKLFPPITKKQAKESLSLLERLDLIKKDHQGKYQQTARALSTDREIQSMVVRNFHKEMGKKAIESIDSTDPLLRDISGITFGLPASKIQDLKDQIVRFRKELTSTLGSLEEETDEVYHLNIQLFPLTKKDKK